MCCPIVSVQVSSVGITDTRAQLANMGLDSVVDIHVVFIEFLGDEALHRVAPLADEGLLMFGSMADKIVDFDIETRDHFPAGFADDVVAAAILVISQAGLGCKDFITNITLMLCALYALPHDAVHLLVITNVPHKQSTVTALLFLCLDIFPVFVTKVFTQKLWGIKCLRQGYFSVQH